MNATEARYKVLANELIDQIADAEVTDAGKLTDLGAGQIASLLMGVAKADRGHVFWLLDEKPGLWDYKDSQGREWHYKLRQFRNYHRDLFIRTSEAS